MAGVRYFLSRFEPSEGCWEWKGPRDRLGYGRYGGGTGPDWRAHRLMWDFWYGEIPKGLKVLHSCDNRGCVNPDHLRLGTQRDNILDAMERGRWTQLPLMWERNRKAVA